MCQVLMLVTGSNKKLFPICFVLNLPPTLVTILMHTEVTEEQQIYANLRLMSLS